MVVNSLLECGSVQGNTRLNLSEHAHKALNIVFSSRSSHDYGVIVQYR
jgi:hypothetical protein